MKETPDTGKISFPEVVEQPVTWGYGRNLHQTDRYKAIVDPNAGKLFSIVSEDYRLIRHEEAIKRIEQAIYEVPDLGEYKTYTGFYNDGGRMLRTYRFYEKMAEIEPDDYINPEIHLFNSYDVTWPFIVTLGAFRVICENGLVVFEDFLRIRKRHVYQVDKLYLEEEISTALERFGLQIEQWEEWAERQLTERTYSRVMKTMEFGKKATQEIEGRMEEEAEDLDDNYFPVMSMWVFFNILTWYITHRAVSLNHRVDMEKRLRAAKGYLNRIST